MEQQTGIPHAGSKVLAGLGLVGVSNWSDLAALLAALYSALVIGEWLWKKIVRPFCERHGWVKARLRRREDNKT